MITYKVTVDGDGTVRWYNEDGNFHREDGPAIEFTDGYKAWYLNGDRHREDGPAIARANGSKEWWLNGNYLTESEFKAEMLKRKSQCAGTVVEVEGVKYKLTPIA